MPWEKEAEKDNENEAAFCPSGRSRHPEEEERKTYLQKTKKKCWVKLFSRFAKDTGA
jgi:hypothetical protein